jgi:hypothetical protein
MGSLNDLLIHPANGHQVPAEDVNETNQRLPELLTRVWTNTQALLTELDQP